MPNKEIIKQSFKCGDTPSDKDIGILIDHSVGTLSDPLQLPPLSRAVLGTCYKIGNTFVTAIQKQDNTFDWQHNAIGGGVTEYNELSGRPRINGNILSGDMTPNDLGILRDNGGYIVVNPVPADLVYVVRNGNPFVCRVSDLIRATSERRDVDTLEDITDTPPVIFDAIVGSTRYFNTTDGLIYIADTIATWGADGVPPTEGVLYINRQNNGLYRFEGGAMEKISGDGGVVNGDAAAWLEGETGPNASLGNVGDWYINILTGDVYKKTASNTWTYKLNIKGSDAKNIELRNNGAYIQWRLVGDENWNDIVALSELEGDTGKTPNFTIGTVTTLPSGSAATATITGTAENPILNLGIPKGADGSGGGSGQLPVGGYPFDILVKDRNNEPKWLKGLDIKDAVLEIELNGYIYIQNYANKIIIDNIEATGTDNFVIKFEDNLFLDLMGKPIVQDMTIIFPNYSGSKLTVSFESNNDIFEWRDDVVSFEIEPNKTAEISLQAVVNRDFDIMRVRGIVG